VAVFAFLDGCYRRCSWSWREAEGAAASDAARCYCSRVPPLEEMAGGGGGEVVGRTDEGPPEMAARRGAATALDSPLRQSPGAGGATRFGRKRRSSLGEGDRLTVMARVEGEWVLLGQLMGRFFHCLKI